MDKYEVRRLRLLELIRDKCEGKASVLAEKIGRSDSYVSRMLYEEGKEGKKRIGEDMADLITATFGLPPYWLDGELAPFVASAQAKEIAKAFDSLNPTLQESLINIIEGFGVKVPRLPPEPALQLNTALSQSVSRTTRTEQRTEQSSGSS